MSRAIKFRAWDRDRKRMTGTGIVNDVEPGVLTLTLMSHGELMQFTGLTDMNGTDIYEGDVVVAWKQGNTYSDKFTHRDINTKKVVTWGNHHNGVGFNIAVRNGVMKWEVLGNVHQNPELLS
jgi:uncharacterized phage protein (TIGR01671 family)